MTINIDFLLDNLKEWGIEKYSLNEDGSITVRQHIDWSSRELVELPSLNIYKVYGNFSASNNRLNSMKNLPKIIHGQIDLRNNKIQSFPEDFDSKQNVLLKNNPIYK